MRTTVFSLEGDEVRADRAEVPSWEAFEDYEGLPLSRVRVVNLAEPPGGLIQLVEIAAGGHFPMHTSPDVAFCQVVRGRGRLRLPRGVELEYEGPELYVFQPGSLHEWHSIEEDTLLSVCLVKQA
jgi:quercetin dioxygenase-like cupin family protein